MEKAGEVGLVHGVREFLYRIHSSIRLAVATNSNHNRVVCALDRYSILPLFSEVVVASRSLRPKPEPDLYKYVVSRLGLATDVCAAIEDAPVGLQAAKRAGVFAIGLTSALSLAKLLPYSDLVIADFNELDRHLRARREEQRSPHD